MNKKRDLLCLTDISAEEIWNLILTTHEIKYGKLDVSAYLKGKTVGLIFQKPSTRTRISFEVAVARMGGKSIYANWTELQLARGESIKDTARVLSKYLDAVVMRVTSHSILEEFAAYSDIPTINGLSDLCHPVQILSDLYTIYEKFGRLKGIKLAYVGDGNNIANSLLIGASKVGMNISIATPPKYRPNQLFIEKAYEFSSNSGARVEILDDPKEAVRNADIVYTDTFVSMGYEMEREERLKVFLPKYQVNMDLINNTGKKSYFMHCLPAYRGQEVTDEVIDSGLSLVYVQAENRLYMQQAILKWLL
ncbi:MAG: ornithine carbamoyltransferase [Candidatus Geothermarchaeota archaeon]